MDSEKDLDYSQFFQEADEWDDEAYQTIKKIDERYQSPELIASGGMKEIFKVYDTMTSRYIAMAQIRKDVADEYCQSFMKEAYLTASMEHPNIISIHDVGLKENNEPYFTMELKVGSSLAQLMNKDKIALTGLLEIFLKICDAISYAHSLNNLHLDIKPDNIQVGTFGEVQVCDWGLGSSIDDTSKTQEGVIKGTPGYMAPEQGMSDGEVDKQTDVYALGALLYSILTGKIPVAGGVNTIISNTVNGRLEFPMERFPDKKIPESLDAVVRKAMAHEKKDRYASVDLLKNEVNKFLTGYSTEAEEAGFIKEFNLFYRRNKPICLVVFTAILLIGFGSSGFLIKLQESNKATAAALNDLTRSHEDLKLAQAKERESFQKYKEQRKEQEKVSKELLDEQAHKAYAAALYPIYFSDPINSMKLSLDLLTEQFDKTGRIYLAQMIIKNLFITQQFKEIRKYEATDMKPLAELAKNYTSFKRRKSPAVLKDENFLTVLRDLNALPEEHRELRYSMMERMIVYQMALKQSDFTSQEVLIELIKCWNPNWDETQISFDPKKLALTVTGKNLKKMIATAKHSSKSCFFRLMKIDSLSVAGTSAANMYQFVGLNVKSLDIRNTEINSLTPHKALKSVLRLLIDEGQLDRKELRRAPKSVKISSKHTLE